MQDRSLPCLSTCASKNKPSQVSNPQLSGNSISNDQSPNGVIKCTLGVLENYELDRKSTSRKGDKSRSVSRRFFIRPSRQESSSKPSQCSNRPPKKTRMDDKLEKVYNQTNPRNRIPRDNLQYSIKFKDPSQSQSHGSQTIHPKDFKVGSMELGSGNFSIRKNAIRNRSNTIGPPFLQTAPNSKSRSNRRKAKEVLSLIPTGDKRMSVVAKKSTSGEPNNPRGAQCVYNDRCVGHRMGHTAGANSFVGGLESKAEKMAYQPERIVRYPYSSKKVQASYIKQSGNGPSRQSNSNSLLAQSRRDKISKIMSPNQEDSAICKKTQNSTDSILYSREIQHNSRPLVTELCSNRLAFERSLNAECFQPVGNPTNRLIRNISVQGRSPVRVNRRDGCTGTVYKCLFQKVGLRPRVGVPTATADSQGYSTFERGTRDIPGCSSQMDRSFLENNSKKQSHGGTYSVEEPINVPDRSSHELSTSGSSINDFGGLEGTGWNKLIMDLLPEDVDLLKSAWRSSTWKTYTSAWKDWIKWCKLEKVVPNNPAPHQLARYFSYLFRIKKVAYSTILVRKSVIAIFANPESEHNVTAHPIVRSILKAISLKSAKKSLPKPQVWNIQDLINWLKHNPPDCTSIYQVSRHCALLLLLISGRRIHDLTLLLVDEKHCELKEDAITFWPTFGSKTDKVKQRQSGWLIHKHQDSDLDIVKWVNCLIEVSSERRRACPGLVNLFITTRGKVKPASRSVIAGWLKPIFISLGLEVAPGSIRSAVASYNFENNLPLDDLLQRGNWRGAGNFFKHYYKSVSAPSRLTNNILLNSFEPV